MEIPFDGTSSLIVLTHEFRSYCLVFFFRPQQVLYNRPLPHWHFGEGDLDFLNGEIGLILK